MLLAITLNGVLQRLSSENLPEAQHVRQSAPNYQSAPVAATDADWGKGRDGQPSTYQAICQEPKNSTDADLCQQWRTAENGLAQIELAHMQLVASFFEIGALVLTVILSAVASIAAVNAAKAAREAIATDRPWMTFDGIEISFMKGTHDGETMSNGIGVRLGFRNTGRSPALTVRLAVRHVTVAEDDETIPVFAVKGEPPSDQSQIVGPDVVALSQVAFLGDSEAAAFLDGKLRFFVFVRLTYFDTFNPKALRQTDACGEIMRIGEKSGPRGKVTSQYMFAARGEQNTAS